MKICRFWTIFPEKGKNYPILKLRALCLANAVFLCYDNRVMAANKLGDKHWKSAIWMGRSATSGKEQIHRQIQPVEEKEALAHSESQTDSRKTHGQSTRHTSADSGGGAGIRRLALCSDLRI